MKKLQIILVVIIIFPFSCSKSFLEEGSRTVTIQDLINNPQNGAQRILGAVYNKFYDWNIHSFAWIGISSITSDEADKGSVPGDGGSDKIELDAWNISPSNISFNDVWEGNFEGIGRATYAIFFIEQMQLDAAEKMRYIGEAKFLRAYFYWNLVRCFGGVPKIDKVLENQADIEGASQRATEAEIYQFIISDLQSAITSLPMKIAKAEQGRPSLYSAKMFLSKVYLYQKNYGMSKAMISDVVQNPDFGLLSDYAKIWREEGEFSKESIWEINSIATNPPKGITGYTEVQGMRGSGDGDYGWGFNVPSSTLYQSYESSDLRRDATFLKSGSTLWDGFVSSPSLPNPYYNYKAYVSKTAETYFDRGQSNKNLRIFRYGEALLILAETSAEMNDLATANKAINELRKRAGLSDLNFVDKADAIQKIYKERQVEMAMEHDRIFDLRRTGRAGTVLRSQGKGYVDGKHDLFPIPQRQIDLSGGKITQNPMY
jgi:hypothetical protein